MRSLALETSGRTGSAALAIDGRVLREASFAHGLRHAAHLLPLIDEMCRAEGWRPADISRIDVSIGPGSFTGLRIGVTLAKTLAFATGAKLTAVPSLRVLAENAPTEANNVLIVLDAKRGQIFTARFEQQEKEWIEAEPPHLDRLADAVVRSPKPLWLLGEGLPYHPLPPMDHVFITAETTWTARAAAVTKIGKQLASHGEFTEPDALLPLYIRLPEAEEKRLSGVGVTPGSADAPSAE